MSAPDIGPGARSVGPEGTPRRTARRTRSVALLSLILLAWVAWDLWGVSSGTGTIAWGLSPRWAVYLTAFLVLAVVAGGAAVAAAVHPVRFLNAAAPLEAKARSLPRAWGWVLTIAGLLAVGALLMAPDVDTLQIFSLRLLLLLGAGLGAALFLPIPGGGYGARLG